MNNPYAPIPMRVEKIVTETEDGSIRTISLSFAEGSKPFAFIPGQFSELSIMGVGEAPFGIASSPMTPDALDFTIARVGTVTTELHYLEPGETIGLRGPLGNGYPVDALKGRDLLVIGGGFGFSTLRAFTNYALHPDNRGGFGRLVVVYGARNPGLLLYRDDLRNWASRDDVQLIVTVDRAEGDWAGAVGNVPSHVKGLEVDPASTAALVCGPPAMIRYTLPVLDALGLAPSDIFLSLEMKMKCGIGKCGRCSIGGSYVCIDGPVYSLARLRELPGEFS
ncbi:MAG TPA: FAD/NAD(P)-binding protein [Candidatus Fermentibacter daniensis]|nr:FAD/NAD(P)-binding protein [Candidatus Fermentibacter daniensis]HPH39439.1 FAD/NAD(P)-binding protein [Candidatus Fermentibacter daniensis]HPN62141.1 FAD/NAD(P)-binding protein [Candidatus Fermentibacter daniensis]